MPNINNIEIIKVNEENYDLDNTLVVDRTLTSYKLKLRGGLPSDILVFKKPIPFAELESLVRKNRRVA